MSVDQHIELRRHGNRMLVTKNYEQAEAAFEGLIRLAPKEPAGLAGLIKLFQRVDRHVEVIEKARKYAETVGRSGQLNRLVGDSFRVLAYRGKDRVMAKEALRFYDAADQIREDCVSLQDAGDLLLAILDDPEAALSRFERAAALKPEARGPQDGLRRCRAALNESASDP